MSKKKSSKLESITDSDISSASTITTLSDIFDSALGTDHKKAHVMTELINNLEQTMTENKESLKMPEFDFQQYFEPIKKYNDELNEYIKKIELENLSLKKDNNALKEVIEKQKKLLDEKKS
jgi:hypothetical protein